MIRSNPQGATAADEQQISEYIQEISRTAQDTVSRTHTAVKDLSSAALEKHAVPVVGALEDCRQGLLAVDVRGEGQEKIPPLAFKTARAMKVRPE
jgi:signal transduction histidine kinase